MGTTFSLCLSHSERGKIIGGCERQASLQPSNQKNLNTWEQLVLLGAGREKTIVRIANIKR